MRMLKYLTAATIAGSLLAGASAGAQTYPAALIYPNWPVKIVVSVSGWRR